MRRWREFDYTGQWDGTDFTYRPVINVILSSGAKSIQVVALIDSGCDCVMVNKDIAGALNVTSNPLRKIRVGGITGLRNDGFKFEIAVQIGQFDSFLNDATFVPGLPFACLLGQRGFFDFFNVRFEKKKQKFYLQQIS